MHIKKTNWLLITLALAHWSTTSAADIKVESDVTDLPPPIVLQQLGVTVAEYEAAVSPNRRAVEVVNPDLPASALQTEGSAEAVELTADAHRAMMESTIQTFDVSTQEIKVHIQGDNDQYRAQGEDNPPYRAPRKPANFPESEPPVLASDPTTQGRATGDQVRNFPTIANSGWFPPDTQIGVGGGFVLAATNAHYAIYDLNGAVQGAALNPYNTFFAPALPTGWAGNLFDPKIVYNPWNGRWVMLILGVDNVNQTSFYFMAFSQTSNPNDGWWLYRTVNNEFAPTSWLDYSGLAVDQWGIYASGNMFAFGGSFDRSMIRYHDNDGFAGGTLNWRTYNDLRWPDNSKAFTLQPATAHSGNVENGGTTFFVNTRTSASDKALLWKLSGHTGPDAPASTLTRTEITVDTYNAIGGNVNQPGSTTDIDGGDARVLNAVYSQNNVYATLTNDINNNADRAAAYTFRLGTNTNTKEWAANLQSAGWYYTYPAVTIKGSGGDTTPVGVFMSITRDGNGTFDFFASSGAKLYESPEVNAAGVFEIYRTGLAPYVRVFNGRNRWGDYSGAAYDWNCPGRMWGATEFAGVNNTWGTQAAAYMMDNSSITCGGAVPDQVETTSPNGTITDTTPTLNWLRPTSTAVTSYRVIVSLAAAVQVDTVVDASACIAGTNNCSFTVASPLPLGAYTFTVQAINTLGPGPVSVPRSFTLVLPPPNNDAFSSAIGVGVASIGGTLLGATQDGSTNGAGNAEIDVWYAFTAPADGTLLANTCGSQTASGLDSVLSVHGNTGGPGTAANQLALNDDWGNGGDLDAACSGIRDSALRVDINEGDNVLLRVSRFNSSTNGAFTLNVGFEIPPPANDSFDSPELVGASGGNLVGTLLGGTGDGFGSADSPDFPNEPDVWYSFVAPSSGTLRVNTCGSLDLSNINTVLSLHADDGTPGTSANELAANDEWEINGDLSAACPGSYDSSLSVTLSAGEPVLIRVTRGDQIGGLEFELNVSFESSVDSDGDGTPDEFDNCTLVPNPDQRDTNGDGFGNICDPDLNNDGVVNFADIGAWVPFFNTACGDVDQDFTGGGACNFADYSLFPQYFLQPPGPSGVAP